MLRYDFNTKQEYNALFNYLDTHGYTKKKAPGLPGMFGGWHIRINTKQKTYYEAVIPHMGMPIQCKNFTEVIGRIEAQRQINGFATIVEIMSKRHDDWLYTELSKNDDPYLQTR